MATYGAFGVNPWREEDSRLKQARADADYYRRQAEEREEQLERQRKERDAEREERRASFRSALSQAERSAGSWPEALSKNESLLRREAIPLVPAGEDAAYDEIGQWFSDGADACKRALEIWQDAGSEYFRQITDLRIAMAALELQWRQAVAARLSAEASDRQGWQNVASEIADPDSTPQSILDW